MWQLGAYSVTMPAGCYSKLSPADVRLCQTKVWPRALDASHSTFSVLYIIACRSDDKINDAPPFSKPLL